MAMQNQFPQGMPIRRGPSMGQMPQAPIQEGIGADISDVANFAADEVAAYGDREAKLKAMVQKRQDAMALQAAKEAADKADAEFAQAQADEDVRQFDVGEKQKDRDAKRREASDAADVKHKEEGRVLQKDRDKSLAEYRTAKLAQGKSGGRTRKKYPSTQGYGGHTRRVLENINEGYTDEYEASEQNTRRLTLLNKKREELLAEDLKTGHGTKGQLIEEGVMPFGWSDDYEGESPEGLLAIKNRSAVSKKRIQRIDKEIEDRENLANMIDPPDDALLDVGGKTPSNQGVSGGSQSTTGTPPPADFQGATFTTIGQYMEAAKRGEINPGDTLWIEEYGGPVVKD